MSILVGNPFLLNPSAAGGYQVSRSLRFNSADSAYLSRTPASAGNRKTFTWAAWVKRAKLGAGGYIFSCDPNSSNYSVLYWDTGGVVDALSYQEVSGGTQIAFRRSAATYRDPSAWYHVVLTVDTTQATAGDRIKMYVNGSQITTFNSQADPSQNADFSINSANQHNIGRMANFAVPFDGYLADIWFLDGIAATPSDFAETDATTGQWIPKTYAGSKGTNGFHLEFADNSSNTATTLGKDTSGNSNNWTPNNFSVLGGGPTSVAAATGALPIYNTTDTYGTTKGTGTRTDANASSLSLAIALDGTNGGTTFTDESATIRGSGSAKSITVNGNAQTSTAQSKFYGSSGYFDGSGDYLSVPVSTDLQVGSGNFTVECWFRTASGSGTIINFGNLTYNASTGYTLFLDSNTLYARTSPDANNDITYGISLNTWYHVAYVRSGNTLTLYVDGISVGTKSFSGTVTDSSTVFRVGYFDSSYQLDGYVQDVRVYKGVAKYTANFNEPTSTVQASLSAGIDSLVDTPTSYGTDTGVGGEVRGNYATLNPIDNPSAVVLANGNLDHSFSTTSFKSVRATQMMSSGKWYFEMLYQAAGGMLGIARPSDDVSSHLGAVSNAGIGFSSTVVYKDGSSTSTGVSFNVGDILGCAFDADAGKVWFSRNGTWVNSGNPAAGTNAIFSSLTDKTWMPAVTSYNNSGSPHSINFGARAFSYQAPSGFKALVDTNLPAPVVAKGSAAMDVKLYTGNGSTQTISGLNFSPDLVWIKRRNDGNSHRLYDTVRGAQKHLTSNGTDAESTAATSLDAFNSDGFTLGANTDGQTNVNISGGTYVAWTWDAGSSTVTNTQGSITSSVRANASAGFSVVTYTGSGSAATVGHGLGIAPGLVIVKCRSNADDWLVYSAALGNFYLRLQSTDAAVAASSAVWNNTAPTSSVFSIGTSSGVNTSSRTYVAYCFAPVAGYSSFGSYTGNGSADGPFVFCNFRPRWIMIKRTDAAYGWYMYDTARDTYNIAGKELLANASDAEVSDSDLDILSNGFKPRRSSLAFNASGGTFIYAAFAESPFQYARAR